MYCRRLQSALEELGYVVEVAHDGPSALQRASTFHPDVALLDIGLPVMDGYELAGRLHEVVAGGKDMRLVAIAGYGQEADKRRGLTDIW